MTTRLPTFYLSHGGGPWPYMTGEVLRTNPKGILVISGHWEERNFAVMAGLPDLARRVHSVIQDAGFSTHLYPQRGFDQGTCSLLAVTHPEADIPVIQISIRSDYDPESHLTLGRALAPLRDEGILIIGSGSSYHNFHPQNPRQESAQFDAWLQDILVAGSPKCRYECLLDWARAPFARAAHPQENHLVPLFVAVGAAEQEPGQLIYREENFFGRITISSYRFG